VKKKPLIIGAVVIVVGLVIVLSIVKGGGEKATRVYTEPVAERSIEAVVTAPGQIDPRVKVNLNSNVIAKIEKLHFKEGDAVRKGQLLVDLERANYEAAVNRMQASLASQEIELRRAQVNLENAEVQFRRAERLRSQGIQAEEAFDQAKVNRDNALANLDAAREGVRQARALLRQAEEDLSYTRIVAPMDGKVVQLNAQEGEVVVTGTMNNMGSVIAIVADLSEILVEADVTEIEVVNLKTGLEAKVAVDAINDKTYAGRVVEIGSSATLRAGSTSGIRYFKVKVLILDPDDRLRPGMTAQVDIVTSSKADVLCVPVQSVVERVPSEIDRKPSEASATSADDEKSKYVFVIDGDEAKAVEVTTGISDATHVEVATGLSGSEEIVTGPFRTLRNLRNGEKIEKRSETADRSSSNNNREDTSSDDESEDEEK
jgi:HlyD family secretion protein